MYRQYSYSQMFAKTELSSPAEPHLVPIEKAKWSSTILRFRARGHILSIVLLVSVRQELNLNMPCE